MVTHMRYRPLDNAFPCPSARCPHSKKRSSSEAKSHVWDGDVLDLALDQPQGFTVYWRQVVAL